MSGQQPVHEVKASDFLIALPEPTTPRPTVEESEPPKSEQTRQAVMVDDGGTPFDSEKHNPIKHPSTGRWMPKRPKKSKSKEQPLNGSHEAKSEHRHESFDTGEPSFVALPRHQESEDPNLSGESMDRIPLDAKSGAKTACLITHLAFIKMFGKEGTLTPDEHKTLETSYRAVLEKRNVTLSPEWGAVAVVATLFGDRMMQPCGVNFIQRVKNRWRDWRESRAAKKVVNHVRSTQRKAERNSHGNDDTGA